MATETTLNQVVKGAPPPGTKIAGPEPLPPLAKASSDTISATFPSPEPAPPTYQHARPQPILPRPTPTIVQPSIIIDQNLPSAPPQIYLNLLILESSLRAQYLTLLARRRLNSFFLFFLLLWNLTFTYLLFLRPREDAPHRLGGSPYWVIETLLRLCFIAGVVAALLIKATGQWETGVRWPRRWLSVTNRGLRPFNLRVVVVKRGLWKEMYSYVRALAPFGGLADGSGDWHFVESPPPPNSTDKQPVVVEEDLCPSGDHLLLLLLPKNFSSEFRENWETYRSEYWDRENDRRSHLRKKVAAHKKTKAKELGGWKWWTGAWRIIPHPSPRRKHGHDLEKHPHGHHSRHQRSDSRASHHSRQSTLSEKDPLLKANRRRSLMRDSSTHSRQSSRSSTPHLTYMLDGTTEVVPGEGKEKRVRRGSSVSSTSSARRTLRSNTGSIRRGDVFLSPLTMTDEPEKLEEKKEKKRKSRPGTPTVSSSENMSDEGLVVKTEDPTTP